MAKRIVTVMLEEPPEGGMRVYSDELPGLILSGPNKAKIISAIEPAVRALLALKGEAVEELQINARIERKGAVNIHNRGEK